MFDNLMRDLEPVERGVAVPVSIPLDEERYLDRECPADACHAEFKVLFEDWGEKVRSDRAFCPVCRHEASIGEWNTDEQWEYLKAAAIAHLQNVVHSALTKDARQFNRAQRPGFIQVSMRVERAARPIIVPVEAAEIMRQKYTCEACGCRYASIGAAFFCPTCGHNSVITTFTQTVETIRRIVSMATSIRSTLANEFDEDLAQDSVRNMLETGLGQLVGAFQQYAEALFEQLPNASQFERRKNVFQNLAASSALWRSAVGRGYEDMLSPAELREIESLFQKRHLFAHRGGIVDQEYIDKAGDTACAIGQRLVIQESTVLRLATLLSALAGELRTASPTGR